MSDNYYKALGEIVKLTQKNTALREDFDIVSEERDRARRNSSAFEDRMGNLQVENGKLQQRLTAAEQRNAELTTLLREVLKSLGSMM